MTDTQHAAFTEWLNSTSITQSLLELPNLIKYNGITFERCLGNDCDTLCLVYVVIHADYTNPQCLEINKFKSWINPFIDGGHSCGFLQYFDNIRNDKELLQAIWEMKNFLIENELI